MHRNKYNRASSRIARRSKMKKIFNLFLKIGLPTAVFVGFILLSRAEFLQVKNFEVMGTETIPQKDIKNVASDFISGNNFFVVPRSNIFLLNKEKLVAALLSRFGRLERVAVNKLFFSESIELSIIERRADFLWCSPQEQCFFMTKDGFIFEKSNSAEASLDKISFRGNLEGDPLMRDFVTPEKMQNYLKLIEVFKNAGFEISSINIESADKAVAKSSMGDIIFDPGETNLSLTAQNAVLLINDIKNKNPSARFNYIDTRFGNKVFYKLI